MATFVVNGQTVTCEKKQKLSRFLLDNHYKFRQLNKASALK